MEVIDLTGHVFLIDRFLNVKICLPHQIFKSLYFLPKFNVVPNYNIINNFVSSRSGKWGMRCNHWLQSILNHPRGRYYKNTGWVRRLTYFFNIYQKWNHFAPRLGVVQDGCNQSISHLFFFKLRFGYSFNPFDIYVFVIEC